ncbi:MAG: ribonuclease P protein component [Candidatus Wildermuthbacteria bacterium]|nr:ribonuclease P protein component [Candidatus Wildermuthbacteria bacterium]
MLPKALRLTKTKEFERVFRGRNSVRSEGIVVRRKENQFPFSRFAVVVSKKVSKKAVERNQIRRFLSEAIRKRISEINNGWDIVIIALPGLSIKTEEEAARIAWKAFKKASLLQPTTSRLNV